MTHLEYVTALAEQLQALNGASGDAQGSQDFDKAVEAAVRRLIGKRDN